MDPITHDEVMKVVIGIPYFMGLKYLTYISQMEDNLEVDMDKLGGTSYRFLKVFSQSILHDSPSFIDEILDLSQDQIKRFMDFLEADHLDTARLKKENKEDIDDSYVLFNEVNG
ncbi:MAG: hypothetical protein R6U17_06180 [Thermoplasmata archaeon]